MTPGLTCLVFKVGMNQTILESAGTLGFVAKSGCITYACEGKNVRVSKEQDVEDGVIEGISLISSPRI